MKVVSPIGRFARPEWERRFLLNRFPANVSVTRVRQIVDRYIIGTRLRLRRVGDSDGMVAFKLTQKLSDGSLDAFQGHLTTIYLSESEYDLFATLPARVLEKIRHSVPPLGIDLFSKELAGLILAEAEFSSLEEAAVFEVPEFLFREVTCDPRFTGGSLAVATRQQMIDYLQECEIAPDSD
jgi:CYTH domain-containing protein